MHVAGHFREAFGDWAEGGKEQDVVPGDAFYDEKARPIHWLFGQLWHCSDVTPWDLCEHLDMPRGSSYAQAVQRLAARQK